MDRRFPVEEFRASEFAEFFGKETSKLKATRLSGGASNSNYLVETSSGKQFVCRIHSRGNTQIEKRITEQLQGLVPAPTYFWESDKLSVMEYIKGEHFSPSAERVRNAGHIIGRLNKITFERSGEIMPKGHVRSFENWPSYKDGLRSLLQSEAVINYLPRKTIIELEHLLEQQTTTLQYFDTCRSLVHGDFRPDNILILQDRIVGVIDWEFAHSGCSYMDIGNLLRHVPKQWEEYLKVGLNEEGFQLPNDWRFRAALIDLTSHLEFLTSKRSDTFKQTCVDRINQLIQENKSRHA